ncbi:MAG: imidazole glycerol phosphate synthase subunit HisH [Magnetococcales bacterium]|nr:imidazole glycerol phosphate synthase subunit HisH [Magnetococcales bacterium]MBF0156382.1 imidazole glycerol phosphate synthase subunit HisH [Magnetococcales bacterium]
MVTVIDYGSGNLRSVAKALEKVGGRVVVRNTPEGIESSDRLLLPGVGAFGDCRRNLEATGFWEPVLRHVASGKPFLGICVGMQLLFTEGTEFGTHPGLDLIGGRVVGFSREMPDPADPSRHLKVPHMGWNRVRQEMPHELWQGIPDASHFYFVHSFHCLPDDPRVLAGSSDYGVRFVAAVIRDNIVAAQFHPEKSQDHGLRLLANFLTWKP